MHIFNKEFDLYTVWQRIHRVALRAAGVAVALFATNRAHALTYSYQSACPTCYVYGGAICGTGTSETRPYTSDAATGITSFSCITVDNDLKDRFVDSDSGCFNLLRSWGMCTQSVGSGSTYLLRHSGLNCTTYNQYQGYQVTYQDSLYSYNRKGSGYVEFMLASGSSTYHYVCCTESGLMMAGTGTGVCCLSSNVCLEDQMYGNGSCRGLNDFMNIRKSGNGSSGCKDYFQDYFRSDQSTGYCDAYGNIYVEGTGALFIAEACWGDRAINGAHMNYVQCGVIITSCNSGAGYYSTNKMISPLTFSSDGDSAYCKSCPSDTHAPWWCGIEYSIYSQGSGIESCYASPNPNPLTRVVDSCGIYELHIASSCTDSGACTYVDCQYQE